ncbi:MAG: GNAT family N-acetyltransferase [Ginsengibacter sp.]
MDFNVKDKLDKDEYNSVVNFLDSLPFYCIEQHPDWNAKIDGYPQTFFFSTDDKKNVTCFANIILSKGPFKVAKINFGPAFSDFEILKNALLFLHNYFSSHKFIFFSLQLGINISDQTELLEYTIIKDFKVKYNFKPENLWSSISVDLTRQEADILRSFSKGHKSAIKRADLKSGLKTTIQKECDSLESFIALYIKMMEFRKLPYDKEHIIHSFNRVNDFINKNDKGFIEYIFDGDTLVGGVIIIYQGNSARYLKGATDPERKDIPILHLGLFEAMKFCKATGKSTFDLWGYNHLADEKDQTFYINRFKKGFSGNFNFYPKRMNFILNPVYYKVFKFLKYGKHKIERYQKKGSVLKNKIFSSKKDTE